MAKRIRFTIETSSRVVLQARTSTRAWCSYCRAESDFVAFQNAPALAASEREAWEACFGCVEVHRLTDRNGSTLICLNSLLAVVQKRAAQVAPKPPERNSE